MGQLTRWINHVGNHRTCFSFGVLLIVAHLVMTAERVYRYRHAGPWIVIARAAGESTPAERVMRHGSRQHFTSLEHVKADVTVLPASLVVQRAYCRAYIHCSASFSVSLKGQCLHFDCALVLLLTLRRSISWLRSRGLDWLLPLDRHVYFHKMIGWCICFFGVVHTVAHVVNHGKKPAQTLGRRGKEKRAFPFLWCRSKSETTQKSCWPVSLYRSSSSRDRRLFCFSVFFYFFTWEKFSSLLSITVSARVNGDLTTRTVR